MTGCVKQCMKYDAWLLLDKFSREDYDNYLFSLDKNKLDKIFPKNNKVSPIYDENDKQFLRNFNLKTDSKLLQLLLIKKNTKENTKNNDENTSDENNELFGIIKNLYEKGYFILSCAEYENQKVGCCYLNNNKIRIDNYETHNYNASQLVNLMLSNKTAVARFLSENYGYHCFGIFNFVPKTNIMTISYRSKQDNAAMANALSIHKFIHQMGQYEYIHAEGHANAVPFVIKFNDRNIIKELNDYFIRGKALTKSNNTILHKIVGHCFESFNDSN